MKEHIAMPLTNHADLTPGQTAACAAFLSSADQPALAAPPYLERKELFHFRASLSQWRAFHAVIACGGYTGAAEYLHVTQPAISYSITKLERQFGVRLIKMNGRRAEITSVGQALFPRSHELLRLAADLETMASSLRTREDAGADHQRADGAAQTVQGQP